MNVFSISGVAGRLTYLSQTYIAPRQVYSVVVRLVAAAELPDRRVGRQRVILDSELPAIAAQLGLSPADLQSRRVEDNDPHKAGR